MSDDWDIKFTKILKNYNAYPETETITNAYRKHDVDIDSDDETDAQGIIEKYRNTTLLNLGAFSTKPERIEDWCDEDSKGDEGGLDGLLKVLTCKYDQQLTTEDDFRINYVKYHPGKDDVEDQTRLSDDVEDDVEQFEGLAWNTYIYPGEGPIPKDTICVSKAIRCNDNTSYYCNAHHSDDPQTSIHYPYCQSPEGEDLYLTTKFFKENVVYGKELTPNDFNITTGVITSADINRIRLEWKNGILSLKSVDDLFKKFINTRRQPIIQIVKHNNSLGENEFYIISGSRDSSYVNTNIRGTTGFSSKMGFKVLIRPGSECDGRDPEILTKLEKLMGIHDRINAARIWDEGINPEDIFGNPELTPEASTCAIGIPYSSIPRPGRSQKDKKKANTKFEGPVQINFKKDDKSSSIRIYNSGKMVAVNLPINWDNKLDLVLAEFINSGNVLNKARWRELLIILNQDNRDIQKEGNFRIIPEITFISVLHGEIYYNDKKNIILNLDNVAKFFRNIPNKVEMDEKNEIIRTNSELLVNTLDADRNFKKNLGRISIKFIKGTLNIALQIYAKNFTEKNGNKAIAQIDISTVVKSNFDQDDTDTLQYIKSINPYGDEIRDIEEKLKAYLNEMLQTPGTHNVAGEVEMVKVSDKMKNDYVVPGRIPQRKKTGGAMYPCRTAKERPVPYNFTGKCNEPLIMNHPGVKSEWDDRYYPCCVKPTNKNKSKNLLDLKEGFPHNDSMRQLYDLPKEGDIDWHSGVFSKPIIPGQWVDIEDGGEIKSAEIINISGKNNTNITVNVDGESKDIEREKIIPQNRTFKGLVDVPEEKLRSSVKGFCRSNACKDIEFDLESKEESEDPFSKLEIDRQNIVPLSANGFESFTKVPYIAAAVPVGAKETYIWLRPDGIFEVDDSNSSIKIGEKCISRQIGTVENILLHAFKHGDKFYPIDLLYWGIKVDPHQPYISSDPNVPTRLIGLSIVWEQCLRDKMINPFEFINSPGREQGRVPENIQEHTKNIVDAGYNILFIPVDGDEPFYSCCPRIFDQTIKMKIIGNSVGGGDGILNDVIFEKGSASDGEVWNFRLDVSSMTWKPINKTTGEVTSEKIQSEIENIRHPVSKRIFKSIPWKVRFRNGVKEYVLDRNGILPLRSQELTKLTESGLD